MAGFAPVAGGAGGQAEALVAQVPHHHLAGIPWQGNGADVGGVPRRNHRQAGDLLLEGIQGVLLERGQLGDVVLQPLAAQSGGGSQGGDLRGGLRA